MQKKVKKLIFGGIFVTGGGNLVPLIPSKELEFKMAVEALLKA